MMKNRKWLLALALLLCTVTVVASALPGTVAYIVGQANTVRNTFRVEYLPPTDISVPVRVHKTVECWGKETISPAGFVFLLENIDTGERMTLTSRMDGWAAASLTFTADDVGKTYRYRLLEMNDGREFVTYDETVYDMTIALRLDEQHEMFAIVVMAGEVVPEVTAEFVNLYQAMDIPDTGDDAQPLLWLAMLIISGAGLAILRRNERRFRRA